MRKLAFDLPVPMGETVSHSFHVKELTRYPSDVPLAQLA